LTVCTTDINTICPDQPTNCVSTGAATVCFGGVTLCTDVAATVCPDGIGVFTTCPVNDTMCPLAWTNCPSLSTSCAVSMSVTLCPDGTGGTWTTCPTNVTRCPMGGVCGSLVGDLTGDGQVTILDMITARNNQFLDPDENGVYGDITGDGQINILDMIAVRNQLYSLPYGD